MNILNEDMIKFEVVINPKLENKYSSVECYSGVFDLQKRLYNLYKCKTPYTVFYKDELVIDSSYDDISFEEERELILNRVKLIDSVKKMEGE